LIIPWSSTLHFLPAAALVDLLLRHLQNQLPKIFAIEQLEQRLGERLDPDHDVSFLYQLAVFQIAGHFGSCDSVAISVVEDDDAFHAGAVDE
jgi:hypothetical protein